MALTVFPDGLVTVREKKAPKPAQSPPPEERILWQFKRGKGDKDFDGGPFPLSEVRERIFQDLIVESDYVSVEGADWAPARSYPVLVSIFEERVKALKASRGNISNCANHPGVKPEYFCPACMKHLCRDCVKDDPLLEGISRYVCSVCEVEVKTLSKINLKKLFGGKTR